MSNRTRETMYNAVGRMDDSPQPRDIAAHRVQDGLSMATDFGKAATHYWQNLDALHEYASSLRPVLQQRATQGMVDFFEYLRSLYENDQLQGTAFESFGELFDKDFPKFLDVLRKTAPDRVLLEDREEREAHEEKRPSAEEEQPSPEEERTAPDEESDADKLELILPYGEFHRFRAATRGLRASRRMLSLLHRSALVTLVSFFEVLLADIFREYYSLKPMALSGDERILSFNELKSFKDLQEAVDHIIFRRVDSMLREGFDEWRLFFQRQLKVDIPELISEDWPVLLEIYERRNLFVHNDGVVNSIYLAKIEKLPIWGEQTKPQAGKSLGVTRSYLDKAVHIFTVMGLTLLDACWTKMCSDEAEQRDSFLLDCVYQLMVGDRWDTVESLCAYGLKRGAAKVSTQYVYQINRWLAFKRRGRWDEVAGEVEQFDTGACHPQYALAVFSLRNDIEGCWRVLGAAEVAEQDVLGWPVLEEMRAAPEFQSHFRREYPKRRRRTSRSARVSPADREQAERTVSASRPAESTPDSG